MTKRNVVIFLFENETLPAFDFFSERKITGMLSIFLEEKNNYFSRRGKITGVLFILFFLEEMFFSKSKKKLEEEKSKGCVSRREKELEEKNYQHFFSKRKKTGKTQEKMKKGCANLGGYFKAPEICPIISAAKASENWPVLAS